MTNDLSRRASFKAFLATALPLMTGPAAAAPQSSRCEEESAGFGPFLSLGQFRVPPGVRFIASTGFARDGDQGHARYREVQPGEPGYGVETRFRRRDAAGRWFELTETLVNPFMFGAKADYYRADGSENRSATDDSAAIQEAIDNFPTVFFPNRGRKTGYLLRAPLYLRPGSHLWGKSTMGSTTVTAGATALISTNGDTILNLRQKKARECTIEGLTLYCPDRSTHGIDVTPLRTTLRDIHILSCNVGIGGISGEYGDHSNIYNVHCCRCNYGAQRLRDTRWYGGRISASKFDGIALPKGANDNKFDLKIDFNDGWGITATEVSDLAIFSEAIDRNGKGGIRLRQCRRVSGVVNLVRNGNRATADGTEGTHLYIQGSSGVNLAVTTGTGVDDRGKGANSPRNGLVAGDGNSKVLITGDLGGAVDSPIRALGPNAMSGVQVSPRANP